MTCGTGFTRKSNFLAHKKTNKTHTLLLESIVGKIGRVEDRIKYRPWGCPPGHNSGQKSSEEHVVAHKKTHSVAGNTNFSDSRAGINSKFRCCYFTFFSARAELVMSEKANNDTSESMNIATSGTEDLT